MSSIKFKDMVSISQKKYRVVQWLKVMRVQTALVTVLSLWAGYVTVSNISVQSALFLGAIGLLFHIFGFTMNEVKDMEYDSKINNGSIHPIASGKIDSKVALYVAWYAFGSLVIISILVSYLYGYPYIATAAIAVSVIPAYMYNEFSKEHWWSNGYLTLWIFMMVLSGSLYAGMPNNITLLLAIGISIQLFVQVIEGDLKDLTGDENTMSERMGVKVQSIHQFLDQKTTVGPKSIPAGAGLIVLYSKKFTALVYGLKLIELTAFIAITYTCVGVSPYDMRVYTAIYFGFIIIFTTSLSSLLVYVYDRDRIKRAASVHELSAIVLIGLTILPLSTNGAILVGVAPILWYIFVNQILYADALNPEV